MRDDLLDSPPSSVNSDEIDELDDFWFEDDINDPVQPPVEIVDQSLLLFNIHTEAILSCDIHPSGSVAVTGSEDATAYVWSVETGRILMNCVGHEHAVRFVGFSFDGDLLVTMDVRGTIKLWECNFKTSEPWRNVKTCTANNLIFGMWHFSARVFMCGVNIGETCGVTRVTLGHILVFNIESRGVKILEGEEPIECGKLFPNGTELAAGYADGSIKLWNIFDGKLLHHIEAGHKSKIGAIDVNPENNLFASVSYDGVIVLMSPASGQIVAKCQADNLLKTISFFKDGDESLMALGCLTGSVTIWDVDTRKMRFRCFPAAEIYFAGVAKTVWVDNILVAGCLDGKLRCYDPKLESPVMTFDGHTTAVMDLCYNKQKNLLLATADDGTARIFKYDIEKDKD